jgi:uncharacterized protein YgbK (DUF1537 family)
MQNGKLGGFGVGEPIDIRARLGLHAGKAIVPDIATQTDIERALAEDHDLPIGARGLAEAMAAAMAPGAQRPDTELGGGRAYAVIGSTDPITLTQLDRLRASSPRLNYLPAPNGVGPSSLPYPGAPTVIQATPGPVDADARSVANALADTLTRLAPPAGSLLVLSGGATAQAILERLGIRALLLAGEALPGLPLATAGGWTVVTKSGGFGAEDTLQRLLAPFHAPGERAASQQPAGC